MCCTLVSLMLFSTTSLVAQYCTSSSTDSGFEWLTNVTFAGINNSSGPSGYTDFTDISGSVSPGLSYEFSGTLAQEVFIGDNEYIQIWIDWNQDEIFSEDERTQIGDVCNSNNCTLTDMVDVPVDALVGETRMRVIQSWNVPSTDPCVSGPGGFDGETEDYTIVVQSGECTPPSLTYTVTNNCEADTYSVSALINSYGTNSFITIVLTRSDAVPASNVNLLAVAVPVGSTVPIINNVPLGVTVSASIQSENPICNLSANFAANICPAENDVPCDAIALTGDGTPYVGNNFGATADVGEVAPPQGGCATDVSWCDNFAEPEGLGIVNNSVWFTFVGPASGRARINGCNAGATYDTQFAIYSVEDCNDYGTFDLIGANDDLPFGTFGSCGFSPFVSAIDICVEPGETYYLQVDGYDGAEGTLSISVAEIDGAACDCVPPVVDNPDFLLAETFPYCVDGEVGYTVTFNALPDLGSSEFMTFTYNYGGNPSVTVNVAAGESFSPVDVIPLGTLLNIVIDISDENCADLNTIFPLSGAIAQDAFACEDDCEGTPGGEVGPGSACDADGSPGAYNADCECVPSPENDECADALPLECGVTYTGSTIAAVAYPEGQPFCTTAAPTVGNGGVWYTYTPTNDTDVEISLEGSTYDTKLFVYSGSCDALACEIGNDDFFGLASFLETSLTAGETYYVFVTGFGANRGDFVLNISCIDLLCSPTISSVTLVNSQGDPQDCAVLGEYYVEVTLAGGTQASYNVTAGSSPVTVINANGTGIVGPISSSNPTINVLGTDDSSCGASQLFQPTICPPTNDLPCDAIAALNDGSVTFGSNIGASADIDEVAPPQGSCVSDSTWCDNFAGTQGSVDNSVWFTFVGPETGRVRIDGCNEASTFDSQFAVYTASDCNDYSTFELVGANDDAPFAVFGSCSSGAFRAGLDLCIEPGVTYYLQVDGYVGAEGTFGITIEGIDAAACSCEPPVVPAVFTFADTAPFCEDGVTGYTLNFYAPDDLGSSEFFVYSYSYVPGDTIVVNVPAGGTVAAEDIIPLGTLTSITITLSDENCAEANTGFPISGAVVQNDAACDPDCEGVPGGPAIPGTSCQIDGVPGAYSADCECVPTPANDLPCNAISLQCGSSESGSTTSAGQSGLGFPVCTGGSGNDVFYSLDIVPGTEYTVTVNGANYDGVLVLYSGACDDLVEEACADNGLTDNVAETITFTTDVAETITIRTYDWATTNGEFTITVTCVTDEVAVFNGTVGWNSNCDDRISTVTFYEPNTSNVAATYQTTVNSAGEFTIPSVLVGTYDIIVDVPGYLNKGLADVVTVIGENNVDFGTIRGGDANDSNSINIADFSGLNAAFGSVVGNANYNLFADFNCSGTINIADFSGLNAGFGQGGANAPLP